jgi:hypothetical protein
MTELRINRELFLRRVEMLFEPLIIDTPKITISSPEFKNMIYITFLLSLKDLRENEIYKSRDESYKWYITLLEHVVNSDIAKITNTEKRRIAKSIGDRMENLLSVVSETLENITKIDKPKRLKLAHFSNNVFDFPQYIEDSFIKKKILGYEYHNIEEYIETLDIDQIIEKINKLKRKNSFTNIEKIIFDTFANERYVSFGSEINTFLMNKIPRYSQYMAGMLIEM